MKQCKTFQICPGSPLFEHGGATETIAHGHGNLYIGVSVLRRFQSPFHQSPHFLSIFIEFTRMLAFVFDFSAASYTFILIRI
jgi:hypothetical protein